MKFRWLCLMLMLATQAVNADDNLFRVRKNKLLKFKTNDQFQIGSGTTVELSFRPLSRFEPADETQFQCLMSCSSESEFAFAILLKTDYDTGQAQIGMISNLADISQAEHYVNLTKIDSYNDVTELILEKARTYHLGLSLSQDAGVVDVFLDGHPQGSLRCELDKGKCVDKPLTFGGTLPTKGSVAFEGELGGFRIWNTELPEPSIIALHEFGRNCNRTELTMLYEFGFLLAYGDFTARSKSQCKLIFPDHRFGGVWRERNAVVVANVDHQGTFLDFPVYTFLRSSNRMFQVYEDTTYIGNLVQASGATSADWDFQHIDRWPVIRFKMNQSMKSGRPTTRLVCTRLPNIPRPFAGKQSGSVVLERGSLDIAGEGFNTSQFFSKAEKDRRKLSEDMTTVFLLGNNVRYRDVIYGGYNVTRMDPFNLFRNGVGRSNYLFARPEQGLFEIDSNQVRIVPADLRISNLNMGESSAETYYVSNAAEYSQIVTSRMGAGVSGSVSVGTGAASPVSVQATVNMSIVLQSEDSSELMTMETTNQDKMISVSTYQHYDLHHKKEMLRLDPEFRKALLQLHTNCKSSDRNTRQVFLDEFFNEWGTHFVFGGTFGAIKWSERTIEQETVQSINKQSWDQYISINEGRTGSQESFSSSLTETLKSIREKTRSVGGKSAGDSNSPAGPGDEPAPISLDLRAIADLCSPQFFPENYEIVTKLRDWINVGYTTYLRKSVARKLTRKNPSAEFKAKAEKFMRTGDWQSLEPQLYQVRLDSAKYDLYSTLSGRPLSERDRRKIKSVDMQVMLESRSGQSRYWLTNPDSGTEYLIDASMRDHFIPFESRKNEIITVRLTGSVENHRRDADLRLAPIAKLRPVDCEFIFDGSTKAVATSPRILKDWQSALAKTGAFQLLESKRKRQYLFSQNENAAPVPIRHTLGPFVGDENLPSFFVGVSANYRLLRVPSTSSIWANMNANSRSSIKSTDPRFGSLLTPQASSIDYLKNRSTDKPSRANSTPQPAWHSKGDGR